MNQNLLAIKKRYKILITLAVIFVLLPALMYALLRTSAVQTWLTHKAAAYLSKELKTDVRVGGVDISWFFDIVVEDVFIGDKNGHTLLAVEEIVVDFEKIHLKKNQLKLKSVTLENPEFNLLVSKGDSVMNMQFLLDYFAGEDTTSTDAAPWTVELSALSLNNASFSFRDYNKAVQPHGIDFNHLELKELCATIEGIEMLGDTINANIKHLSASERSGFVLNKFSAFVSVSSQFLDLKSVFLKTPHSDINLDLRFDYASYNDYNHFIDKVKMDILIRRSFLALDDVAAFVPDLYGMNTVLDLHGAFKGKVSNLRGKDVSFTLGRHTAFNGNFSVTGLPDMDETYINFKANNFTTTLSDLNALKLPGNSTLKLPPELIKLGFVNFKGNFTGFINDFVAYGLFNTSIGDMRTDISLKNKGKGLYAYKGKVALNGFDLGRMFDRKDEMGKVTLNFDVNGEGFTLDDVDVELTGMILSADLKKYEYKNITVAGNLSQKTFTGYIAVKEPNLDMDFEGVINMNNLKPVFDFSANVRKARLDKLKLTAPDVPREISAFMKCRFNGTTSDDISGIFLFKDVVYSENDKTITMQNLQINNASDTGYYKNIVLNSELFDANFEGRFAYADIPASFAGLINKYLPSYVQDTTLVKDSTIMTSLRYDIKFKKTSEILELFVPGLVVSEDFNIYGSLDYAQEKVELYGAAGNIKYRGVELSNWLINAGSDERYFGVKTQASGLKLAEGFILEGFHLNSMSRNDSVLFGIEWLNSLKGARNSGDINGYLNFESSPTVELGLLNGRVYVNDSLWVVDAGNKVLFDSNTTAIYNLAFRHNRQLVALNGFLSEDPNQKLNINFNNFDISDFNPLLEKQGVEFKGILSGKMSVFNVYKSPGFIADILIKELVVNGDKLGNLILQSNWENENERLSLKSEIVWVGAVGEKTPFKLSGYYYPKAEKDNFDLSLNLESFSLKLLEKFLSSFSSDFRGLAYGDLTLKGSLKEPVLNGTLTLRRASIKIDYLNTTLSFSDEIGIMNNMIVFDSLVINDNLHKMTGLLNGYVFHNNFKDFRLDMFLKMNNLLCLDTDASQNDLFYGKAFATGSTHIHGPVENIVIDVIAKTERNTRFFLPLTSTSEISENPFISFVSKDTTLIVPIPEITNMTGIQLNFELEVTPEAEMQIIFDSKVGDIIKAKGAGNLKMEITPIGDFNMFGTYVIEDGDYLFTLQNFINKRFRIQKGSSISWSGDPYEAQADVNAIYALRTPLYDLVFFADSSEEYKKRMPVNCMLGMKGNLFNPEISFAIELPGSDEKTRNLVNTIINTESEVNRQMFALLALNRFLPPAGLNEFSNVGIGTGLEATSTELLSNQLSNWLSQISKDFDIGVNYRAGNELSSDEVEVALSTQLFNDRVTIDGSVGTAGTRQNASQIVGDVNVELKLTEEGKLRMKFYNKSNAVDMLKTNAPYTQGIGVFYRREFDSFKELFNKAN